MRPSFRLIGIIFLLVSIILPTGSSSSSLAPLGMRLRYSVDRLPDGAFSFRLSASNILGLASSKVVQTKVLDTAPPTVNATVTPSAANTALLGASAGGMVSIQLTGNAETYWYSIEEVDTTNQTVAEPTFRILTDTVDATTTALNIERTQSLTRTLPTGQYTVHVWGCDQAGNIAHTAVSFTLEPTSSSETSSSQTVE
ncbi:MAG: hypothetical protein ACFFGZ_13910 [Candidatus Thorarchaeota archaeon]